MASAVVRRIAVIPARYESRRFPGKMMAFIDGEPLIARTVRQVARADSLDGIWVATDHGGIANAVRDVERSGIDVRVVRTPSCFGSGTERVAWAVRNTLPPSHYGGTVVVNVQGDQPHVNPEHVLKVMQLAQDCPSTDVATLATPVRSIDEFYSEKIVKCIADKHGRALYFSRAPIPYKKSCSNSDRTSDSHGYGKHDAHVQAMRHLGLYAFRANVLLEDICSMARTALEEKEDLEQLRWLYHGARIRVGFVPHAAQSVDLPSDLAPVAQHDEHVTRKAELG